MWIVKASLKNPYAVSVLAFLIMVIGGLALANIPVDILPVFKAPAVQVMTYYQGMPTGSIEKTITNRIERWTNQATGCRLVESKSTLGVSVVRLYFRDDIDPNGALTQVNSLALGTLPTLPPGTLPPVVLPFDPTGTLPLGILSVTSPELDETSLKDTARIDVRNMLGSVPGVVAPAVFGGKDRQILIIVKQRELEARNLSPRDVVNALDRQNFLMTAGVAKFGSNEVALDSNSMVNAVRDFNDMPIRLGTENNTVYLREIGRALDAHSIQTALVRINGHRQVYVPIYRQQGASSLAVIDGLKKEIPYMTETLKASGRDVKLDLVMDQSIYVREAIRSLIDEGIVGAVLVGVMILIFLGNWRMTVIACLSIPLSILCAIIGLYATGNTINAMTLGGLALAIGPLVDDAIVVLENTHRHHGPDKSWMKAAFDGAVEVTVPVLVATLTTIIVLCPIAFMPGMGGFLFRPLTLAVAFAMLASFLLSRTLVPVLCANWLGRERDPDAEDNGQPDVAVEPAPRGFIGTVQLLAAWFITGCRHVHRRIDVMLHAFALRYEKLLARALRHRTWVLASVGLLFLASLSLLFFIGQEFFPQVDAGQITIFVRSPSGTNIEENERRVADVEHFLEAQIPASERRMIIAELGLVPDWSAAYTPNSGSQDTVIKVQLRHKRTYSAQEYAMRLRDAFHRNPQFADLRVSFDTGGMISAALNYGVSSPIDVQIEGGSFEKALAVAQKVREKVAEIPGTADVRIQQRIDAPQRVIMVDRKKAAEIGLSEEDVMSQVATAMNSSVAIRKNFWIDPKNGNQYFVAVIYEEDPQQRLQDVLDITATGTSQPYPVKLSSLVRLEHGTAPVEVNHVSLARVFNVLVNTRKRDIGSVARDIQKKLDEMQVPTEMRIRLKGEYGRMRETFSSLGLGLVLAATLVYLLLVVLFRSYKGPFIIMFTVPLGLIGVLGMLFLTRTTLNVQSSMGVIFLVGIVVSNGVLLVDFANKLRADGLTAYQAITTAAGIRFRPILMTFLATFLDLVPMAIGLGRGSEANAPLARAVVGGLLTSTFLTLIIVPILYTLLIHDSAEPALDVEAELSAPTRVRPPSINGNAAHRPRSADKMV